MSVPYSEDLRKKVLALVKKKVKRTAIAQQLEIGRTSIYRWSILEKETGSVAPRIPYRKGPVRKITDLDAFKIFVDLNKDLTQKEMGKKYGDVSKDTIGRALRKIGYSRKKRATHIQSAMKNIEKNSKKS